LFLGYHPAQLKKSNHLSLPSNWKESISGGIYITQGFDQNLLILTTDTFKEIYVRITSLNITDPLARLLMRMFMGTARHIEMDESRAISIPRDLMNYANLKEKIVIVGQGDYIEVWSQSQWNKQQSQIQDAKANAQRFSSFTIVIH
jgi:MraZ protein